MHKPGQDCLCTGASTNKVQKQRSRSRPGAASLIVPSVLLLYRYFECSILIPVGNPEEISARGQAACKIKLHRLRTRC